MDYVVFGIGFGATILVLGLLLRDFGPRLRFRTARDGADVLSVEELVGKVSWTRFCTALGSVLALAGAVFLLITLVAMILVVSDDTGLWVMSTAYALLLVIMAYWTWAYFHRFGSYGILPERAEAEADASHNEDEEEAEEDSYAGPPLPWADDDTSDADVEVDADQIDEPVADHAEPMPEAGEVASGHVGDERDDVTGEELAGAQEGEGETEPAPSPRLETPEERLAHTESPIDHGSAEGDLDLAASGPRRPGSFNRRQPDPTDESDVDDAEPEQAEGRDRA